MSRLLPALLLLILPLGAAARPTDPVSEKTARAAATRWADSDPEKELLAAYLAALDAATTCESGPCEPAAIKAQIAALRLLDERENALPKDPATSAVGRPLLALSALASGRLAHAAAKTKDPKAADYYIMDDELGSVRQIEGACLVDSASCAVLRRLIEQLAETRDGINACAVSPSPCSFEGVDALLMRASVALVDYLDLPETPGADTTKVFVRLDKVRTMAIFVFVHQTEEVMDALEAGSDAFEKDLKAPDAAGATSRLQDGGKSLLDLNRRATIGADRLAYFLGYDKKHSPAELPARERVNRMEERLAGQRARAHAILIARGLSPEGTEDGVSMGAGSGGGPKTVTTVAPVRTLLDRRLVPKISGPGQDAPSILPGGYSTAALIRRLASSDPVERADAMRRLGMTRTTGSPGAFASHAFSQKGDESCAVAIQVQVLRAQGLLPEGDPYKQEDALMAEALAKGFRHGGTAPEYAGSLLAERGMIVTKRRDADWSEMESLLRRGGLAQASVNANILWGQKGSGPAGHSVLVTGAEISKRGGRILGVYINDSGTDPAGAGRFVPIDIFQKAWKKSYAEIR